MTSTLGFVASAGFRIDSAGPSHLRRRHWLGEAGLGPAKQSARVPLLHQRCLLRRLQAIKPQSDISSTHTTVDGWVEVASEGEAEVPGRSTEENEDTVVDLVKLFNQADANGNGKIELEELRQLLQSVDGGLQPVTMDWLREPEVWSVMKKYDVDGSGDICFEEFKKLVQDGVLLNGKLEEYQRAFQLVDTTGNGTLGASEIAQLFKNLGQPLSPTKLFKIMEEYDGDGTGQIMFPDFLNMFRAELLDLQAILMYLSMDASLESPPSQPSLIKPRLGEVSIIFSEAELDQVLEDHKNDLVVLEASLTWCRPCKGFEPSYKKFAEHYKKTVFLKFYGNSNENTKHLFKERLNTPLTPTFTFWRNGEMIHEHSGANKQKLESGLQSCLTPEENPLANANPFQVQMWHAKAGL